MAIINIFCEKNHLSLPMVENTPVKHGDKVFFQGKETWIFDLFYEDGEWWAVTAHKADYHSYSVNGYGRLASFTLKA